MIFKKYKTQIKELKEDITSLTEDLIRQRNKIKLLEAQKKDLSVLYESQLEKEQDYILKIQQLEIKVFERETLRRKAAGKLGGLASTNSKLKKELEQTKEEFTRIIKNLNKENRSLKVRLQPPTLSDLQYPRNKKLKKNKN